MAATDSNIGIPIYQLIENRKFQFYLKKKFFGWDVPMISRIFSYKYGISFEIPTHYHPKNDYLSSKWVFLSYHGQSWQELVQELKKYQKEIGEVH